MYKGDGASQYAQARRAKLTSYKNNGERRGDPERCPKQQRQRNDCGVVFADQQPTKDHYPQHKTNDERNERNAAGGASVRARAPLSNDMMQNDCEDPARCRERRDN